MANVGFTRDEVILTLDTLYTAGDDKLTKNSSKVAELCATLQLLPIHPTTKRPPNFRNTVGVSDQIRAFKQEIAGVERPRWGIGKEFHEVASEFEGRHSELHQIAEAIRRNMDYFSFCNFGQGEENVGFPEGALLSHLHMVIERRDSIRFSRDERCAICQISIDRIYNGCGNFLEHHLLTSLVKLDANKRYGQNDFITVCPNCHAALHRYRPWKTRDNLTDILR